MYRASPDYEPARKLSGCGPTVPRSAGAVHGSGLDQEQFGAGIAGADVQFRLVDELRGATFRQLAGITVGRDVDVAVNDEQVALEPSRKR